MKKFNKAFNTDTTYVKFFGSKQFHKVSNINDTRVNIQVAGLGGSFQRGHVETFTNKIKNAPSPRMKKEQYRIENGNIYEYNKDSNAYIFYAKTYALTKKELKEIKKNT